MNAESYERNFEASIMQRKLSAMFRIARGMPAEFVKVRTKQVLVEITAAKKKVKQEQMKLAMELKALELRELRSKRTRQ